MKELFYTPTKQELIEHVINGEDIYRIVHKYDGNEKDPKHISTKEIMRIENTDSMLNLYNFIRSSALYFPDVVDIDETKFKLKYLDKEDIESLGLKLKTSDWLEDRRDVYEKGNFILIYNYKEKTVKTFTKDPIADEIGQFSMKYNVDYSNVNRFYIKNIMEAKKFLKQLNIK